MKRKRELKHFFLLLHVATVKERRFSNLGCLTNKDFFCDKKIDK
jgi:hypothetical protein